jgi:uncharacterized membrane protein YfcA
MIAQGVFLLMCLVSTLEYLLFFFGAYLAAVVSGAAGFGGALLLLPLLTSTVGPESAVPLLTVAQFVGNVSRVGLGYRVIHWRPVGLFLVAAVPAAMLGAWCFVSIPKPVIMRLIGAALLGFVVLHASGRLKGRADVRTLVPGGALTGFLSGLVGSAGPTGAAFFLGLGLPPVAYIASEATTALTMHAVKMVIYQRQLALPVESWALAVGLGIAMILGTWSAKQFIEKLSPERFRTLVTVLLGLIGLHMIVFG